MDESLSWFDPAICYYCYKDHDLSFHDKPAQSDAFGMVLYCTECGVLTTASHTSSCSRSGIMLGERHHRRTEE